jgi:hypothetical protein
MLGTLRWKLGSRVFRLGLRLLGYDPARVVLFSHGDWAPGDQVRWGVAAARSTPETPDGITICVISDQKAALEAEIEKQFAPAPPPAPAPNVVVEVDAATMDGFQLELGRLKTGGWLSIPQPKTLPADIDRRVKVVTIGSREVLDWFTCALRDWPRFLSLPRLEGLPTDARVLMVREEPYERTFKFLVAHPSFEPVCEGQPPPPFPGPCACSRVAIELPDGGADADSYKLNPCTTRA